MPRLFAGLELPENIRDQLDDLYQPLPSTRWIASDDFHITLRFAGDVTPPVAREFVANLAAITFDPFTLRLANPAVFGGDDPRTLFATVEPSQPLADLARAVETAARRSGLPPEGRKFTPHVTLARLQSPPIEPIARYLSRRGGFRTDTFLVTEFALFSAKPNTGGGPYVIEQTFHSTIGAIDELEWRDDGDHEFNQDDNSPEDSRWRKN